MMTPRLTRPAQVGCSPPCPDMLSAFFFLWNLFLLIFFAGLALAKPQCRLVNKLDAQLGDTDPGQLPLSATPTSASATQSATSTAFPSIAPFNYGKDVIRGVNL